MIVKPLTCLLLGLPVSSHCRTLPLDHSPGVGPTGVVCHPWDRPTTTSSPTGPLVVIHVSKVGQEGPQSAPQEVRTHGPRDDVEVTVGTSARAPGRPRGGRRVEVGVGPSEGDPPL